jgi:hypothetical protein
MPPGDPGPSVVLRLPVELDEDGDLDGARWREDLIAVPKVLVTAGQAGIVQIVVPASTTASG